MNEDRVVLTAKGWQLVCRALVNGSAADKARSLLEAQQRAVGVERSLRNNRRRRAAVRAEGRTPT